MINILPWHKRLLVTLIKLKLKWPMIIFIYRNQKPVAKKRKENLISLIK